MKKAYIQPEMEVLSVALSSPILVGSNRSIDFGDPLSGGSGD